MTRPEARQARRRLNQSRHMLAQIERALGADFLARLLDAGAAEFPDRMAPASAPVPSWVVPTIAGKLGPLNICADTKCTRIVVEKPFGHDLASAHKLNELLSGMFSEKQIYRIDHYLGKETVQNILALRFANALFEPIWNRNYIDHIQITAAETVGVENRGDYYEGSGALRDMVQNHILQLMCMIGMEAPVSFDADEIRNKKVDVLRAIRKFSSGYPVLFFHWIFGSGIFRAEQPEFSLRR